ncbi:MAG TPA: glycogen synthase GlgA [Roseiarcus sp.]|nr:glycogen synthase GlgA [Roseiarcus sp.]
MKILIVTSEFADFAKTGGLADVSAALPRALRDKGIDVRVLLPGYQKVVDGLQNLRIVATLPPYAGLPRCLIGEGRTSDDLAIYVVIEPALFQRNGGLYGAANGGGDWPDNDVRYARLSLAGAEIGEGKAALGWKPDLVHAHDWQTGLTPAYLRWRGAGASSVFTIHNLAHQGLYPAERCAALGAPESAFSINGVEFHGRLSFMKAGVYYADHVTTVSPNYAREITEEAHGGGLHGLTAGLAAQGRLTGIVNGVGPEWDPSNDPDIGQPFDKEDTSAKAWIKDRVRTGLCLAHRDGPLFGVVSRLVHQKGLDLVAEVAGDIVERGGQIAILGVGDPVTEEMLRGVVRAHPDDIAMLNGYNEPMARRIMAASDFYLMPSRFEPCGLSQMHAQLYGALPIVHATGGLVDTVEDGETGFVFRPFGKQSFLEAIGRAFSTYGAPGEIERMRRAAMSRRYGYDDIVGEYIKIYAHLTGKPLLRVANNSETPRSGGVSATLRVARAMSLL